MTKVDYNALDVKMEKSKVSEVTAVNGYTFRESNSAFFIFASLLYMGPTLEEKNLLLEEQILSFKS